MSSFVLLSCSRTTYNEQAKVLELAPKVEIAKKNMITLEPEQFLSMKEGEIKVFTIKLATPLDSDATILWSIEAQAVNSTIKPSDRFKQIEGSISAKKGEQELRIEIPGQDIDPLPQGDQMFHLNLSESESELNSNIDLKLIDIVKRRPLPHRDIKTDLKLNLQLSQDQKLAILSLNRLADQEIVVEIQTQNETAIALQDYTPIKKIVTIKAGEQMLQIPYEILSQTCNQEKTFLIIIKNISGAQALEKQVQVTIPAEEEEKCKKIVMK